MRGWVLVGLVGCAADESGTRCEGEGTYDADGDGVVDATMTRIVDGWLRTVGERFVVDGGLPFEEQVVEQAWFGEHLVERTVTGDGALVTRERWTRDEGGRPQTRELLAGSEPGPVFTVFVYEDGRLSAAHSGEPGADPWLEVTFSYATDGRQIREEQVHEHDPRRSHVRTWTYLAPAPSPDAVEVTDLGADGTIDGEVTRWHDADGNVVRVESIAPDGVTATTETWTWNRDGNPLEQVIDTGTSHVVRTWTYDARGLETSYRSERDDDRDGESEASEQERWTWSCGE